jgi:hypothetical protein
MNDFEWVHGEWVTEHLKLRQGERRRRLLEGHKHAEKELLRQIWWVAFGDLRYLHPEYEVLDFMGHTRYIDLAYIRPPLKIAIEVDGFGPHMRDLSHRQFSDQWVRQMHLTLDGWMVIRVSFDDVKERPRLWQQLFQQMIGQWFGDPEKRTAVLDCIEREVIRVALALDRPIKLRDVQNTMQCGYHAARQIISRLEDKLWLSPSGQGVSRIHCWKVNRSLQQVRF